MIASEYYKMGYLIGTFKNPGALTETLVDLHLNNIKTGYTWDQKYANTIDLRPTAHSYHPSILDVLYESSIPELLSDVISPDMTLTHVQIRRSFAGPSYMDWHRDTYVYGEKEVGNFPSVHKIIFYPEIGNATEKLKLAVGSHRRNADSLNEDLEIVKRSLISSYRSSDTNFLLFDTSMMHAVVPDSAAEGSIRIIYSFMRKNQYLKSLAGQAIHDEQVMLYENRRSKL